MSAAITEDWRFHKLTNSTKVFLSWGQEKQQQKQIFLPEIPNIVQIPNIYFPSSYILYRNKKYKFNIFRDGLEGGGWNGGRSWLRVSSKFSALLDYNLICNLCPPQLVLFMFIIHVPLFVSRRKTATERWLDLDQLPLRLLSRSRMLHILLDFPSTQVGKLAKAKKYILWMFNANHHQ